MNTLSLISKLKPNVIILVNEKKYKILQHIVWYQAKCGENYDKYVLQDESGDHEYRLFISGDIVGISKIFHHPFQEPMPENLSFEGKDYQMTQDELCVVKQAEGQEFYKIGDAEIWWDYAPADGQGEGLSLGRNWTTWEREDLKTQELNVSDIHILDK